MNTSSENNLAFAQTCPLLLKDKHLEDPLLVILEFFSYHSLIGYRKELDKWFSVALHEELKHPEPETLIYVYQQFQSLLNAAYLIAQNPTMARGNSKTPNILTTEGIKFRPLNEMEITNHGFYWLAGDDSENPLIYLTENMTLAKIKELRQGLQEWLECALSKEACLADVSPSHGFNLYRQSHEMLEVCYSLQRLRMVNG